MKSHGRRWCGWLFCVCVAVQSASAQMGDWAILPEWREDATLNDVFFVDQQTGWAVGDHGTVLRTRNGGLQWQLVNIGIDVSLESVFFVSAQHGWIVGGFHRPGAAGSSAIVLRTSNGGQSWNAVRGLTIPALKQVQFASSSQGWAIGNGNAAFPAGLYHTMDGGKTWSSWNDLAIGNWTSAHRWGQRILLAGIHGSVGFSDGDGIEPGYFPDSSPLSLRDLLILEQSRAIGVGAGGRMVQSRNGGLSWHPVDMPNAGKPLPNIDFECLARQGDTVFMAGSPGTKVLRWNLKNARWESSSTPVSTGLRSMAFVDAQRGWVVGEGGTIIATEDGGQTWTLQRRGYQRLSYLHIVDRPNRICSELLAKESAERNRLGAVIVLDGKDLSASQWNRAEQACQRCGVSNTELAECGSGDIVELIVKRIRQSQPVEIYLPVIDRRDSMDLHARVLQAVTDAQQPDQFPNHLSELGMDPWRVSRVIVCDQGNHAHERINPSELMPQLAALLGDYVTPSRLLLDQPLQSIGPVGLKSVYVDPLISTAATNESKRIIHSPSSGNLQLIKTLSGKDKKLQQLLSRMQSSNDTARVWFDSIAQVGADLDNTTAGIWTLQLANDYLRVGHAQAAAESQTYLLRHYPQHPLSITSLRWLFRYYASDEFAHAFFRQQQRQALDEMDRIGAETGNLTRPVTTIEDGVAKTTWQVVEKESEDPEQSSESEATVDEAASEAADVSLKRYQLAKSLASSLDRLDFAASSTGRHALARSLLFQKLDPGITIEPQLRNLADVRQSASHANKALADKALEELRWQGNPEMRDMSILDVYRVPESPTLDGKLDELTWRKTPGSTAKLLNDTGQFIGDRVVIRSDTDYLYISAVMTKLEQYEYAPRQSARVRDADLQKNDRIEVLLDIDRDFESFYVFSIDHAGRVAESCGGCLGWNPRWYVAADDDEGSWRIEAAIPLREITDQSPTELTRWAASLRRFAGDRLISAWPAAADGTTSVHKLVIKGTQPQSVQPLESFGFLKVHPVVEKTAHAANEGGATLPLPNKNLPETDRPDKNRR